MGAAARAGRDAYPRILQRLLPKPTDVGSAWFGCHLASCLGALAEAQSPLATKGDDAASYLDTASERRAQEPAKRQKKRQKRT